MAPPMPDAAMGEEHEQIVEVKVPPNAPATEVRKILLGDDGGYLQYIRQHVGEETRVEYMPRNLFGRSIFQVRGPSKKTVNIAVALIKDLVEGVQEDLDKLQSTKPLPPNGRQQWADEDDDDDDFLFHLTASTEPRPSEPQPHPTPRQPQSQQQWAPQQPGRISRDASDSWRCSAPGDGDAGAHGGGRRQSTSSGGFAGGGPGAARGAPGRGAYGGDRWAPEWRDAGQTGKGSQGRRRSDGGMGEGSRPSPKGSGGKQPPQQSPPQQSAKGQPQDGGKGKAKGKRGKGGRGAAMEEWTQAWPAEVEEAALQQPRGFDRSSGRSSADAWRSEGVSEEDKACSDHAAAQPPGASRRGSQRQTDRSLRAPPAAADESTSNERHSDRRPGARAKPAHVDVADSQRRRDEGQHHWQGDRGQHAAEAWRSDPAAPQQVADEQAARRSDIGDRDFEAQHRRKQESATPKGAARGSRQRQRKEEVVASGQQGISSEGSDANNPERAFAGTNGKTMVVEQELVEDKPTAPQAEDGSAGEKPKCEAPREDSELLPVESETRPPAEESNAKEGAEQERSKDGFENAPEQQEESPGAEAVTRPIQKAPTEQRRPQGRAERRPAAEPAAAIAEATPAGTAGSSSGPPARVEDPPPEDEARRRRGGAAAPKPKPKPKAASTSTSSTAKKKKKGGKTAADGKRDSEDDGIWDELEANQSFFRRCWRCSRRYLRIS